MFCFSASRSPVLLSRWAMPYDGADPYLAWICSSAPVISNCWCEGRSLRIFLAMTSLLGASTEKWLAPAMLMKCKAGFCDILCIALSAEIFPGVPVPSITNTTPRAEANQ